VTEEPRTKRGSDLEIRTWPTHYRLNAGHSLRVTVSSDDHPEIDSAAPSVTLCPGGQKDPIEVRCRLMVTGRPGSWPGTKPWARRARSAAP
jgi:predicted acyl esterase